MPAVTFPAPWPDTAAPVATLLDAAGPAVLWWLLGAFCLVVGLLLSRRRPVAAVLLAAVAALALAIAADGLVDDAYIQFRYSANLAAGHGPVFNPGERIEGASGGLWIAVLAAASRLSGLDPGTAGRLLSLAFAPLAVLAAGFAFRRSAPTGAALAALAWAALPTPALYAATGLETLAAATALWLVAAGAAADRPWLAATAGAALVALRPEAPLLAVVVLPWWRTLGRAARSAVIAALAMAAVLTLTRTAYYGEPMPHSAIVKAATAPGLAVGLRYLARVTAEALPLLLLLPAVLQRKALRPAVAAAAAATVAVAAGGGDWMPGVRYLLPLLVLLAAGAGVAGTRRAAVLVALQGALALLLLAPLPGPGAGPAGSMWRRMAAHRVQCRWWEAMGHWIGERAPAEWTIAVGPAGAIPYASGLRTFDLYGLVTPVGGVRPGGEAGHRAWGLDEALERRVALVYGVEPTPQSLEGDALERWVAAAGTRHPRLATGWIPLLLRHPAAHHLDVLGDVLWVRRDLLTAFSRGARRLPAAGTGRPVIAAVFPAAPPAEGPRVPTR